MNKKDIPGYVRRCYQEYRNATGDTRGAEELRLAFYAGGEGQWRESEITQRRATGQPFLTINRCKPAVDQLEGDVRQNPPGPKVLPVGEGADGDTADIHAGLIRECEHRSLAPDAYAIAARYLGASGNGALELATEYCDDRSTEQQCVIRSIEDPSILFWDPSARMANRQDAMWAGKIRLLSYEAYVAQFGANRAVLKSNGVQIATGWIQDVIGYEGVLKQVNEWTGKGKGPFYVVEFCMVETDETILRKYSDNVNRLDSDYEVKNKLLPRGVRVAETLRSVQQRSIKKYTVDALEIGDETEWLGTVMPWIPVLGQEIYIKGKLHRLSLISEALDSNRALNYVATTATQLAGLMPKAPWVGYKGAFADPKWESANSQVWAFLEVTPTFSVHPDGRTEQNPPPQRNQWETPIQWLIALGGWFSDLIKATTQIYDASLGANRSDQSGKAIEQLRSESNTGNYWGPDNLHRAIAVLYQQIVIINTQIMTKSRVVTIVRPDSQHELVTINQSFADNIDPASQKERKAVWLTKGKYAVVVTVGPNTDTRDAQMSKILVDFLQIDPQIMAVPGVAAKTLRAISQGNPEIEGIADLLDPQGNTNPQQLAAQLNAEMKKNQQLTIIVQKLQSEIAAKLPQVEADKFKTLIDNLTKLEVAKITASKDTDTQQADLVAAHMENALGMAHEAAMQANDHAQAAKIADQQAANTIAQQEHAASIAPSEGNDNG